MSKYNIPDDTKLREIYLMWLIAIDSQDFLKENDLTSGQCFAMRNYYHNTWADFKRLKAAA